MFETIGENSFLKVQDLKYKGDQVYTNRNSIADEFAAIANTANGVFVFGADDKSRTVVGIPKEKLDIVQTWIQGICNDLITPQLFCRIRKIPVNCYDSVERVIVRVDIPKSLFVHQSPGGYFQRIGTSKRQMKPDVLARLFQKRSETRLIRFDEESVTSAPRECLNEALWKKFKTSLSPKDGEEFLLKLKLLTQDEDGKICPSVGGLLMACKQPHEFLTNAFIQAVAYRGTKQNAAYQIDAKDITGSLDVQICEAYYDLTKIFTNYPFYLEIWVIKEFGLNFGI